MNSHSDTHILNFLVACCEMPSQRDCVRADALYKAYAAWVTGQGIKEDEILDRTAFGMRMGGLFKRSNLSSGRFYMGIRLKGYEPPILRAFPDLIKWMP